MCCHSVNMNGQIFQLINKLLRFTYGNFTALFCPKHDIAGFQVPEIGNHRILLC